MNFLFTSESVSMGHPDKVADQISDAILDAALAQDPESRVACETLVTTGLAVIAGEITTKGYIDCQAVVRKTIKDIGYTDPHLHFSDESCAVLVALDAQSKDISRGVTVGEGLDKEQGAGDQGMMFGYACDETSELMPLPITLSRKLLDKLAKLRFSKKFKWLKPDSKSQITIEYTKDRKPLRVHTVVISTQHSESVKHATIKKTIIEEVIKKVIPKKLIDNKTIFHVNPTGRFVVGGPHGDCGVTGRKIIVDTYGGMGAHGGGAFSGKDPSKVDRSGAYMARYAAKNVVAAKLAKRCEIEISYAIGVADPISILVNSHGTGVVDDYTLTQAVVKVFDFHPAAIIKNLKLKRPIYTKTARYGHFGIKDPDYTWENTDKIKELRKAAGVK